MGFRALATSAWGILPQDPCPTVRRLYPASALPRWTGPIGALLPSTPALEIALTNTIAQRSAAGARTAFPHAQIPVGPWHNFT